MSRPDPVATDEMQIGQPTWRMALLYPPQGSWTEQEYLALDAGRQIEFDRGCVEVLDLPTKEHQRLVPLVLVKRLIPEFWMAFPSTLLSFLEPHKESSLLATKRHKEHKKSTVRNAEAQSCVSL